MYDKNSEGHYEHRSSSLVETLVSLILLYLSDLLKAGKFYHGNYPLKKYSITNPIASKSSLRASSSPK